MPSAPPRTDARPDVPAASAAVVHRSHSFPAEPRQVGSARRFLMDLLTDSSTAADAVMCLSEVATNSIVHSNSRNPGGQFTVRVEASLDGRVRVEVRDQGGPWIAHAKADGQPLRGLGVVGRLSRDWGICADGSQPCTVWFDIGPAPA